MRSSVLAGAALAFTNSGSSMTWTKSEALGIEVTHNTLVGLVCDQE